MHGTVDVPHPVQQDHISTRLSHSCFPQGGLRIPFKPSPPPPPPYLTVVSDHYWLLPARETSAFLQGPRPPSSCNCQLRAWNKDGEEQFGSKKAKLGAVVGVQEGLVSGPRGRLPPTLWGCDGRGLGGHRGPEQDLCLGGLVLTMRRTEQGSPPPL